MIFWHREPWIMHLNLLLCQSQTPLCTLFLPPSPLHLSLLLFSLFILIRAQPHLPPHPPPFFFLSLLHLHQTGNSTGSGSYLRPPAISVCYLALVRRSLPHLHNQEGGTGTPGRDFPQRWAKTSTHIKQERHKMQRFHSCENGFSHQ